MIQEESNDLIKRIKNMLNCSGIKPIVSEEEFDICVANGINSNNLILDNKGRTGQQISVWKNNTGKYTPNKGFYRILDTIYDYKVPDGRVFECALITNYSQKSIKDFSDDEVIINARPLYNNISIGNKDTLVTAGMTLHIIEETIVVENSYKIVWEIL